MHFYSSKFFDGYVNNIEFLRKMKWLNFMLGFLLDLEKTECKWEEGEQLLVLYVDSSLSLPESFFNVFDFSGY